MSHIKNDPNSVDRSGESSLESEFQGQSVGMVELEKNRFSPKIDSKVDMADIHKRSVDEIRGVFHELLDGEKKDIDQVIMILKHLGEKDRILKGFRAFKDIGDLTQDDFEKIDQFAHQIPLKDYIKFLSHMGKTSPVAIEKLKKLETHKWIDKDHHEEILKALAKLYKKQLAMAAPYLSKLIEVFGNRWAWKELKLNVEVEDENSCYHLALLYMRGFQVIGEKEVLLAVEPNLHEVTNHLHLAAINNHEEAKNLLEKMANEGIPEAIYHMGCVYQEIDESDDPNSEYSNKAVYWFSQKTYNNLCREALEKLAKLGNLEAKFSLAKVYEDNDLKHSGRLALGTAIKYVDIAKRGHKGALERLHFWGDKKNQQEVLSILGEYYEKQFKKTRKDRFLKSAFSYFKKAYEAQKNDFYLHRLACCYLFGRGVKQNINEALKMLHEDRNNTRKNGSSLLLGLLAFRGKVEQDGVVVTGPIDLHKAYNYYKIVWGQYEGNLSMLPSACLFFYGHCAYIGTDFMPQDFEMAFDLFKRAKNDGHKDAGFRMGRMYMEFEGVERNIARGYSMIIEAANEGSQEAIDWLEGQADPKKENRSIEQNILGKIYWQGTKDVPRDIQKAISYFTLASDQGFVDSSYALAQLFEQNPDLLDSTKNMCKFYMRAAEHGHVEAMRKFADLSYNGLEDYRNYAFAKTYYETLSATPSPQQAEYNYRLGEINSKNLGGHMFAPLQERAFGHYKSAADSGHAQAAFEVGKMYLEGIAVEMSKEQAEIYFKRAADAGILEARAYLMHAAAPRDV